MNGRIVWLPILLVAASLYWSTALRLACFSLTWLEDHQADHVLVPERPGHRERGIVVHLVSPAEVAETVSSSPLPSPSDQDTIGRTAY